MPMIAAVTCAASRCEAASAPSSRLKAALREASADASATAQICRSSSPGAPPVVSTAPRFSCRSRAYAGRLSRIVSRLLMSGRLKGLFALLPVAGTQFVGLQRIENAQHFCRIAADGEIGDVDEADHALRVHDVGGPLSDPRFGIENSEAAGKLALDVGEHRERQVLQLLLLVPPGEVHVLAVDADAEQLGIARLEFLVEPAESGDLGGTHEGEILGPEEHHQPPAGEALMGDGTKRALRIAGDDPGEGELRKTLTNA